MRKTIKAFEALGFYRNKQEEIGVCAALVCMEELREHELLRELFGFC